jgi:ferrochelatase
MRTRGEPPSSHVVLVNLGTPSAPEPRAVREFLDEFLSDPNVVDLPRWLWLPLLRGVILRRRPARVAEAYRAIWLEEGSPLIRGTVAICRALASTLAERGTSVDWCLRYGDRSMARWLPGFLRRTRGPVAIVPLFAHRTPPTTGTIFEEARRVARSEGAEERLVQVLVPPDDPAFVEAQAARAREAIEHAGFDPEHLLVSFHSVPERYAVRDGGRYVEDCRRTTEALIEALDWPRERAGMCFQSKFGPSRWVGPFVDARLAELGRQGVRRVAVATPGFLNDGLETVEEIGIRGRQTFLEAGGEGFVRIPCVEDHPLVIEALARAVERRLGTDERRDPGGSARL